MSWIIEKRLRATAICRQRRGSASLAGATRACIRGLAYAATLAFAGCAQFLPYDGPTGQEVRASADVSLADTGRLSYVLVKLSPLSLSRLQTERQSRPRFSRLSLGARAADATVTRSDTIILSIFEAAAGGLFVPSEAGSRPGNYVQLAPQELDRNGDITVPYGGKVHALGRSPVEIEAEIVAKLKPRAIEPQVIVTIGERAANSISVLGDVKGPTNIALRPGGIRLLAAIARAGGASYPDYASIVTVQRRNRQEQGLLSPRSSRIRARTSSSLPRT